MHKISKSPQDHCSQRPGSRPETLKHFIQNTNSFQFRLWLLCLWFPLPQNLTCHNP